eukprot:GCRY01003045.1.p1 GENE.GCRY01003045.1~~GCRY01003045.1.p1  ORF type:complete len:870 (-),score=81.03 GCRY01003045.1:203-2641(-)
MENLQLQVSSNSCHTILIFEFGSKAVYRSALGQLSNVAAIARKHNCTHSSNQMLWIGHYAASETHSRLNIRKRETHLSSDLKAHLGNDFMEFSMIKKGENSPLISEARSLYNVYHYKPRVFHEIKQNWILQQLTDRSDEYTTTTPIHIYVSTWNVNGKIPHEDLNKWLLDKREDILPQIYVIGFQELDLSAEAFLLNESNRGRPWESLIISAIGNEYSLVVSKQLVGIMLCVFATESVMPYISDVMCQQVGVGVLGVMGNKGGVGVRFQLGASTYCFVCSHLAAHFDAVQERNNNQHEITRRMVFGLDGGPGVTTPGRPDTASDRATLLNDGSVGFGIEDHDVVIWLGDLNYRVELCDIEIKSKIRAKDWEFLLDYDQLTQQMKQGRVFLGYEEMLPPHFCPTYKYRVGTDEWEGVKVRTPAWCDRILVRGENILQLSYKRHSLKSSDHKPVSALFEVPNKNILPDQQAMVITEMADELNELEEDCLPCIQLTPSDISFGSLHYLAPRSAFLFVYNAGNVIVDYSLSFSRDSSDHKPFPSWIQCHPSMGTLFPGESQKISLWMHLSWETIALLKQDNLSALGYMLNFSIDNYRTYHIPFTFTLMPTVMGTALEELPLSESQVESEPSLALCDDSLSVGAKHVPMCLRRLVSHLLRHGLGVHDLFIHPVSETSISSFVCLLSQAENVNIDSVSVFIVAQALLHLLASFPEPVIPFSLYPLTKSASVNKLRSHELVDALPPVRRCLFSYLISFLEKWKSSLVSITNQDFDYLSTVDFASLVFGAVLIRPEASKGYEYYSAGIIQSGHFLKQHFN